MDQVQNPFVPGAGTPPRELAGRSDIIERARVAIDRFSHGMPGRSLMIVGLRGVGKTVLLHRIAQEAETRGLVVVEIETPENRSLPSVIIPSLRTALIKLDRMAATGLLVKKAFKVLGSFFKAMKMKFHDVELGIDLGTEPGVADSGVVENDLIDLLVEVGYAAKEKKTAIVFCIDELQYVAEDQFASLITALHKCTQKELPIVLIGAGLPQLVGLAGRAKSYAERLFEYPEIGPLTESEAKNAVMLPAQKLGVTFEEEALSEILAQTKAYPYFLQEWGKHSWNCANATPISLKDVVSATALAVSELDASFFRVRFDRLTPSEKRYLRAMAELGAGPQRSGDISKVLEKESSAVAPVRSSLMKKGIIYSPAHGDVSFTVPLFEEYMKRVMPELEVVQPKKNAGSTP
jgi:hypothetical protein